jgi:hypothetical protein
MMEGFVYVMSNPAMPGLVKIGMTAKMPHLRAQEISAHEGLPQQMQLEYYALVAGAPRVVEQAVHKYLATARAGKEWFRCESSVAIAAIKQVAALKLQHERFVNAERDAADLEFRRQQQLAVQKQAKIDAERSAQELHDQTLDRLLADFANLEPLASIALKSHTSLMRGAADVINPVTWAKDNFGTPDPSSAYERVELWPLPDILLLSKYNAAAYFLFKAGRRPERGWLEREWKGHYLSVPNFVIDEFTRRLNLASDKKPFYEVNYPEIRNWYGVRT